MVHGQIVVAQLTRSQRGQPIRPRSPGKGIRQIVVGGLFDTQRGVGGGTTGSPLLVVGVKLRQSAPWLTPLRVFLAGRQDPILPGFGLQEREHQHGMQSLIRCE